MAQLVLLIVAHRSCLTAQSRASTATIIARQQQQQQQNQNQPLLQGRSGQAAGAISSMATSTTIMLL